MQRQRGVTVSLSTPYHDKTSGGIEIRVKVLQEHLRIRTNDQGSDWLEELPEALMAVNNIVNDETTLSPYMILLGYRPTSPIDMLREPVIHTGRAEPVGKNTTRPRHKVDSMGLKLS